MTANARALRSCLAAASILLLSSAICAQGAGAAGFSTERLRKVDEFIDRTIARGEVTGGVALVARNGKVVYVTARGTMDATTKKPMQKDSFFRMASMTKPVAAVAILMLVEDGKVRLDDPVSKYLPSYKGMKV